MTDAIETILDVLTERRDLSGVLFVDAKIREARAELAALQKEKTRRIYYQDIVYKVCIQLDRAFGRSVRKCTGIVCGTLEHPATEVQEGVAALREERDRLREAAQDVVDKHDTCEETPISAPSGEQCRVWAERRQARGGPMTDEIERLLRIVDEAVSIESRHWGISRDRDGAACCENPFDGDPVSIYGPAKKHLVENARAELAALQKEKTRRIYYQDNEKRGDLLKQLEWSGFKMPEPGEGPSGTYNFCLICKAIKEDGHRKGCELKAALGQEEDKTTQCQKRAIELVYSGECDDMTGVEVRQMLVDEFGEEVVAALPESDRHL